MIGHVEVLFFLHDLNIYFWNLVVLHNKYTFSYCMNFSFQKSDVPSES